MENDLIQRILKALEEVRPVLKMDEGDVELVAVKPNNIVEVRLLGNCNICPISTLTLRAGVESTIKKYAPEVTRVEAVN